MSIQILHQIKFAFIFAIVVCSQVAFAKHLLLFKNGAPVPDYDARVSSILPGDIVEFSYGKVFTVNEILDGGRGNTTRVVDIGDGKVLRFSKQTILTSIPKPTAGRNFVRAYYDNYLNIVESDVPVPIVYLNESARDEFIVVQKVKFEFTLKEFALNYVKNEKNRPAVEALARWFFQSRKVRLIGDFHPGQLVFNGTEWLLVDWANGFAKETSTKPYYLSNSGLWNLAAIKRNQRKSLEPTLLGVEIPEGLSDSISEAKLHAIENHLIATTDSQQTSWLTQLKNSCSRFVARLLF